MSSNRSGLFVYYDDRGKRIEFSKEELVSLVSSGKIHADTKIEFNGAVRVASKFPSIAALLDKYGKAAHKPANDPVSDVASSEFVPTSAPAPEPAATPVLPSDRSAKRGPIAPPPVQEETPEPAPFAAAASTENAKDDDLWTFCEKCGSKIEKGAPCPFCAAEELAAKANSNPYAAPASIPTQFTPEANGYGVSHVPGIGKVVSSCLNKYFSFGGRASRSEFWLFVLWLFMLAGATCYVALLVSAGFSFFDAAKSGEPWGDVFEMFLVGSLAKWSFIWILMYPLVCLLHVVPFLSVTSRRLHDTGNSGWWQLIFPWHWILCLLPSQPFINKYGPKP